MELKFAHADKPLVCVLGGTGFVGQHLASRLVEAGYQVRVPSRRRERHREMMVLPGVDLIQANVHDTTDLRGLTAGCSAVINLVAILNEERRGDFRRVHEELPVKIIHACRESGVTRLLHMSALNADAEKAPSQYLRSKGAGEDRIHAAEGLEATSFRPSIIFGPGDHFFTHFAKLLRMAPVFIPLACPNSRFAPIYVGDLVDIMVTALEERETMGQRYDLCGPRSYTLLQLLEFTNQVIKTNRQIIELSDGLSRLQAKIMEKLPGKLFTTDNYLSLQVDSVCRGELPGLFDVELHAIEEIVPGYLLNQTHTGRLDQYRHVARHEY